MESFRSIIDLWPSAEQFADDIGLKWRSHARVMKVRNSIPRAYWPKVIEAAHRRGLPVVESSLHAAKRQKGAA